MSEKWIVDPCADANGHHTIRVDNGSEEGDLARQPIATVYTLEDARLIAVAPSQHNALLVILALVRGVRVGGTEPTFALEQIATEAARAASAVGE